MVSLSFVERSECVVSLSFVERDMQCLICGTPCSNRALLKRDIVERHCRETSFVERDMQIIVVIFFREMTCKVMYESSATL